jgi:hypothetical protein
MNGGTKFLACSAILAVAACGGDSGKLEIRSLPTPLAQGNKPVSFRVAEGHQQFALGNIALALESYRKAWREDPSSIDALAGIAASYDRMGRFDLSRRSYEAALALEPYNSTVLAMLAASLEQQGKSAEASAVRTEIAQRLGAARPPVPEMPAPVATAEVEAPLPVAELSAPMPAIASAPLAVTLAAIAPIAVSAAFAPDEPAAKASTPVAAPPKPVALAEATPPARSVTITLPAPRPAVPQAPAVPKAAPIVAPPAAPQVKLASAQATPAPAPVPAPSRPEPKAPVATAMAAIAAPQRANRPAAPLPVATGRGPRLERTSLGEVALLTGNGPQWASLVVKQNQRSATVRFVPLQQANARFASVRLLNAARVQGLAARTRSTLLDRGWRSIAIGDASAIRSRSLVLYPAHRRTLALSLARQFGFASAQRASGREITVLLGRDSAPLARRVPAA